MAVKQFQGQDLVALIPAVVMLVFTASCKPESETTRLKVFVAGSLVVPFAEIERTYEEMHPDVDV